jgi:hypothetical protein
LSGGQSRSGSFAILLPILLAACQEAPAPVDNATAEEVVIAETENPLAGSQTPAEPAAPEAAPIPAKFRGIWAEQQAVCAQLSHPSRLIISDHSLRFPEFVLEADSVTLPNDDSFAVNGHNKKTDAPMEAHYSVDATGNILTDEAGGGAVRVNCG